MKNNNEKFEVRDLRDKDKYFVDDKFLNGYAKVVGIYAVGVYNCLCRHANIKSQECWPSISTIEERLSISRKKVIESTKLLSFWNIIKKKRIGKTCNNRYFLINKKQWKLISVVSLRNFSVVSPRNFTSSRGKLLIERITKERSRGQKQKEPKKERIKKIRETFGNNDQAKKVLDCFVKVGYDPSYDFKDWLYDLKKEFHSKDLLYCAKAWSDWIDDANRQGNKAGKVIKFKSSFRNWVKRERNPAAMAEI